MSALAILLVSVAAVCHSSWNLLTKRSYDKLVFIWWTGVSGSVLFLPIVLWWTESWVWSPKVWLGIGASIVVRALYFASLGAAYTRGDLSLVYPLARGTAPVLVPPLAVLLLGERLSIAGIFGIATVVLGVYVLHLQGLGWGHVLKPFRAVRSGYAGYAVLTGLLTTTYSLVDKWSLGVGAQPVVYGYLTVPLAAAMLAPLVLARRASVGLEWRANRAAILTVAVLVTFGYFLVLIAMRISLLAYVVAARELGVVFGALLGCLILRERYLPQRLTGASLIVTGIVLIATAR
jgi:drug/metabolite transporter (DMT)-like permease